MGKQEAVIQFLMSHKELAILLISRLYPLDADMLKKYKHKLEKKETKTEEGNLEAYTDAGLEGRWDEDDNLHKNGCGCEDCERIETERREKEYAMTPPDYYYESQEFIKDTKDDWIYLGPWREDLEHLMKEFGIKEYEGVGTEIWEKLFKTVLDDKIIRMILEGL